MIIIQYSQHQICKCKFKNEITTGNSFPRPHIKHDEKTWDLKEARIQQRTANTQM